MEAGSLTCQPEASSQGHPGCFRGCVYFLREKAEHELTPWEMVLQKHTHSCTHVHTHARTHTSTPRATAARSPVAAALPPPNPAPPPTLYVQSCENSTTLKVNKAHLLKIAPVSMVTPATQNLFIN